MNEIPEELQQRIAAYIDGELPPAEAARLEVYLANTDPALADRIVGMLADKVQVRALPKPQAPADLSGRIMEQVERRSLLRDDEPAPRQPWWQSRMAIAAGLAVVLGGFSYFVASSVLRHPSDPNWTASGPMASKPTTPGPLALKSTGEGITQAETPRVPTDNAKSATGEPVALVAETKQSTTDAALVGGTLAQGDAPASPAVLAPRAAPLADQPATQLAAAEPRSYPNDSITAIPSPAPGGMGSAGPADGGGYGGAVGGGGGFGVGGRGGRGGAGAGGLGGAGGVAGGGAAGGGRGGGRRGAPATPSPAVAAANMQSLAPTTDNTVRALADITRDGRGPMVVTFLAQNDQDYAKLTAALASYADANMRQNGGALLANAQQPQANVAPQNNLARNNSFAANSADAAGNNPASIAPGVNDNGVVVFNNTAPAAGNAANSNIGNTQSGGRSTSNMSNTTPQNSPPSFTNQLYNDQNLNNNIDNSRRAAQNLQLATARGGPYRVALRADQLEELSRNYRLAVVARGDVVVQFRALGDRSPLTADATERANLLQKAGLMSDASGANQAAAGNRAQAAVVATSPALQASNVAQDRSLPATIDCVITMEPAPPTPTTPLNAAPPAQTPAQ